MGERKKEKSLSEYNLKTNLSQECTRQTDTYPKTLDTRTIANRGPQPKATTQRSQQLLVIAYLNLRNVAHPQGTGGISILLADNAIRMQYLRPHNFSKQISPQSSPTTLTETTKIIPTKIQSPKTLRMRGKLGPQDKQQV